MGGHFTELAHAVRDTAGGESDVGKVLTTLSPLSPQSPLLSTTTIVYLKFQLLGPLRILLHSVHFDERNPIYYATMQPPLLPPAGSTGAEGSGSASEEPKFCRS